MLSPLALSGSFEILFSEAQPDISRQASHTLLMNRKFSVNRNGTVHVLFLYRFLSSKIIKVPTELVPRWALQQEETN